MNPDRDETVLRLTEGRVPCVNHEITDYFRTKPDPEVAATEQKMEEEAKSAYSGKLVVDKVECIFIGVFFSRRRCQNSSSKAEYGL